MELSNVAPCGSDFFYDFVGVHEWTLGAEYGEAGMLVDGELDGVIAEMP